MNKQQADSPIHLFYSYSHKDARYRASMETALALLESKGLLKGWSDQNVHPGQRISAETTAMMDDADIIVFLLSNDFFASPECTKEWDHAKQLSQNKLLVRIPIILKDCGWKDMLVSDDIKALPTDGKPVTTFSIQDTAWNEVYEGIKAVIDDLRTNFAPNEKFLKEMEKTDFLSQQYIKLQDIFVFLPLSCLVPQTADDQIHMVTDQEQLLEKRCSLIHGAERTGRTALARHLFLSLVEQSRPVLYVDLKQASSSPRGEFFRNNYHRQFRGDYSLWKKQPDKTLLLDNLTATPNLLKLVVRAKDIFDRVIVTSSSDLYYAFFKDEERLADFQVMHIEPLTHRQQEILIRKRLALSDRHEEITDGLIDHIEDRINSIVLSNKIVPRYPFFVLSILQTYEAFMPSNLSITSYGHCYQVLIVASLIRAGISNSDNDINACFNFAEHLAFEIHQQDKWRETDVFELKAFVTKYREQFLIRDSIMNRMKHPDYGIITSDGHFRTSYMYYYFLGRHLSIANNPEHRATLEQMCEESYIDSNYLTLLFTIHHTNDSEIIDEILLRTMATLDNVQPAILDSAETGKYQSILAHIPTDILSSDTVDTERGRERDVRDDIDCTLHRH